MDPTYRFLFAALLGVGSIGFFSVLWVVPAYYTFIPRRLASFTRVLYCAIGCGYVVAAYFVLQGVPSLNAFSYALISVSVLNLIVMAVERPWSRRDRQGTTPPA
jgi:hypothetical protein